MLSDFSGNINRLISSRGRAVTVRTYTNTGTKFDPTRTPADIPATAVIFDFEARETDGSIIQRNDKEIVLSSTVPIDKQSIIVDGAVEYTLINVEQVSPGSEVLMYIAQGRA